jgi:hypothetical protein
MRPCCSQRTKGNKKLSKIHDIKCDNFSLKGKLPLNGGESADSIYPSHNSHLPRFHGDTRRHSQPIKLYQALLWARAGNIRGCSCSNPRSVERTKESDAVVYKEAASMSYITICIMTEHEGKPLGLYHDARTS